METYTFICGCGHSGTSLLANMFASHPDVYIPLRETECFLSPETADARWRAVHQEARASGKRHFAEKTPKHVVNLALLRAHVTGARIILMVRDGRDVAASFVKRNGLARVGADRWLLDNASVIAEQNSSDVLIVRYEDLVKRPRSELKRICRFAGVAFHRSMLKFHETQRLWFGQPALRKGSGVEGDEHRAFRNWQINQPLFNASGTWKSILTEDDIAKLPREEMEEYLRFFGYDCQDWQLGPVAPRKWTSRIVSFLFSVGATSQPNP